MRLRLLLLSLFLLFSLGCPPDAPPPPPLPPSNNQPTPPPTPPTPPDQPPPTPPPPPPAGGPPWKLIPDETLKEIAWPMLDPVGSWPSPDSLVPPDKSPVARAIDPEQVKALGFAIETTLEKELRPTDLQAAVGLDDLGRLHVKLGRGRAEGSACMSTHPAERPPVFCFALETKKPAAKTIEELRGQVADVVSDALGEELSREKCRLEPHPKGLPGVGLAFLDRAGIGSRFPYLYAYSAEGKLLVVMHEQPWRKLKDE